MIPKPRSKYSYCSICKVDYDDYLEVPSFLFSTFKRISTGPTSKTTNLRLSSTRCARKYTIRMRKPLPRNLRTHSNMLLTISSSYRHRSPPTSTSTPRSNQCRVSAGGSSDRSTAGSNPARLSSSSLMATTKTCWGFMTTPSLPPLTHRCHP